MSSFRVFQENNYRSALYLQNTPLDALLSSNIQTGDALIWNGTVWSYGPVTTATGPTITSPTGPTITGPTGPTITGPTGPITPQTMYFGTISNTKDPTYSVVGSFIFSGSSNIGTPSTINITSALTIGTGNYTIRLQDTTNVLTIATIPALTNTIPTIYNMGTISNIPTGMALFEFQAFVSTGGGNREMTLYNTEIVY